MGTNGSAEITFKYGVLGKVDEEFAEMTGETNYTVEMRSDVVGKEWVNHGVLLQDGTKFFIKGSYGLLWGPWGEKIYFVVYPCKIKSCFLFYLLAFLMIK